MKTIAHPFTTRIPSLAVALFAGVGAWVMAHVFSELRLESTKLTAIAGGLGLLGFGCSMLGLVSFRRARTTVNPMKPDATTVLVVSGVYSVTRNPMYLGFLLGLLAEIVWLGSPIALIAAPAFVIYLNHFQILPEELALYDRFGAEFVAYSNRVSRWL